MLDIYEDTVPRLFFIFPEDDGHWWNLSIDILFTKAFRLFFICEHEIVDKNGKVVKQFHLTTHGGYLVKSPRTVRTFVLKNLVFSQYNTNTSLFTFW